MNTNITHIPRPSTTIVTEGVPVSALYPLDAGSTEVGTLGYLPLTLTEVNQKGTLALSGAPGAQRRGGAVPAGVITGTPDLMAFTSGVKVFEFIPTIPTSVGGGAATEAYSVRMWLMAPIADIRVQIVLRRQADGTNDVDIDVGGSNVYISTPASMPSLIGVVIDAAGTIDIQFDNFSLSLSSNAFTAASLFAAIAVYEQTAAPAGDAAKIVGVELVTLAADMTGTNYPAGATDISGATI